MTLPVRILTHADARHLLSIGMVGSDTTTFRPDADTIFAAGDGPTIATFALRPVLWGHSLTLRPGTSALVARKAVDTLFAHMHGWMLARPEAGAIFQTGPHDERIARILGGFGAVESFPDSHRTFHFDL